MFLWEVYYLFCSSSKISNTFTSCTRLYLCVFVCVMMIPWQIVLEGLVQKNHVTQLLRTPDSVVQAVVRQGERLCAESDPRKGGYPAGYWPWLQVPFCSSQSGQSPQRHSDGATKQRMPALKTQAVFKLRRHSHHSFSEMNFFYSNIKSDSIPKPLLLKLSYLALLIVLALFLSFEVKKEVAPSLTPVSSLLDISQ